MIFSVVDFFEGWVLANPLLLLLLRVPSGWTFCFFLFFFFCFFCSLAE